MCGIVGYVGNKQASNIILDGLSRLEYRGYDSAGIAILHQNQISIRRASGKLIQLQKSLQQEPLHGSMGMGHTRWATHGRPSEANAHPHRVGRAAVVHNGIIENYRELQEELIQQGSVFSSETDTEVLVHLIDREIRAGLSTLHALQNILKLVKGSYALVLLDEKDPEALYVARQFSPLVIGLGEGENFVASDVPALLPYTREVVYLEDGDCARISHDRVTIFNNVGDKVSRVAQTIKWNLEQAEKGGYKHFMLKEIFETPRALADTLQSRVSLTTGEIFLEADPSVLERMAQVNRIYLVACGTSYYAALVGKFYLEEMTRIPVIVDMASEFRYRNPILDDKNLLIVLSQSGETADTLMSMRSAREHKALIFSICNVVGSSIPRGSDAVFYTHAGPEIGVAATKTFVTQLAALFLTALDLGKKRGLLSEDQVGLALEELSAIPAKIEEVLKQQEKIHALARDLQSSDYILFIGRGFQYPIALEGALKLKEISYLRSEGYPAGELKHGPIAMIDDGTPVIALAPRDGSYEKTSSNIHEVLARQASLIPISTQGDELLKEKARELLFVPVTRPELYPLLTVIPLQLMAYEIADLKGHDVDRPRNLAKSVTVE